MRGLASCSNHGDARRSELLNRSELKIDILGGREFWPIIINTEVSFFLVVCGDQRHRAHRGSRQLGAKELFHSGSGDQAQTAKIDVKFLIRPGEFIRPRKHSVGLTHEPVGDQSDPLLRGSVELDQS